MGNPDDDVAVRSCAFIFALAWLAGCPTQHAELDAPALDVAALDAHDLDASFDADAGSDVRPIDDARRLDAFVPTPPTRFFEDMRVASGLDFHREAVERGETLADRMSGGVCVLDVDGHAPLDVFFAARPSYDPSGARIAGSRLFVGQGAWSYREETDARGLHEVGDAWGCLAWDEDADGDDDLLVYGVGSLRLFRNTGGIFHDVSAVLPFTPAPFDAIASASAGDVDDDGDLDLFVGGFLNLDPTIDPARDCGIPGHRCIQNIYLLRSLPNHVFVRDADGDYAEDTARIAPGMQDENATLVLGFSDLNADGHADLFVCNDLGSRQNDRAFVHDEGGTYVDRTLELGLGTNRRGYGTDCMGWSSYDIDGDGTFDHVMSDFEGRATSVHLCAADGFCEDASLLTHTEDWASSTFRWGLALVDVNLDGEVELLESTGHVYRDAEVASLHFRSAEQQAMHVASWNGTRFVVPTFTSDEGSLIPRATRGIAIADLDDDGAPDVLLAPATGSPGVLRNVAPREGRHFLTVRLVGRGMNREAAGAVVEVHAASRTLRRERHVGEGYAGNFDRRLFFGLGDDAGEVEVVVRWPSGEVSRRMSAIDRELVLTQE